MLYSASVVCAGAGHARRRPYDGRLTSLQSVHFLPRPASMTSVRRRCSQRPLWGVPRRISRGSLEDPWRIFPRWTLRAATTGATRRKPAFARHALSARRTTRLQRCAAVVLVEPPAKEQLRCAASLPKLLPTRFLWQSAAHPQGHEHSAGQQRYSLVPFWGEAESNLQICWGSNVAWPRRAVPADDDLSLTCDSFSLSVGTCSAVPARPASRGPGARTPPSWRCRRRARPLTPRRRGRRRRPRRRRLPGARGSLMRRCAGNPGSLG